MTTVLRDSDDALSKMFLFILRPAVYTDSAFLTMTLLSVYGLIHGVACVPKKRVSALRSLLRYGAVVLQRGVHPSNLDSADEE